MNFIEIDFSDNKSIEAAVKNRIWGFLMGSILNFLWISEWNAARKSILDTVKDSVWHSVGNSILRRVDNEF